MEKRKNRKYSNEFKRQVVEEYLKGTGMSELLRKHDISDKNTVKRWINKYEEYRDFPDFRGKNSHNGPMSKTDTTKMTKDEYIKYLEMENEILKQLRSLSNNR